MAGDVVISEQRIPQDGEYLYTTDFETDVLTHSVYCQVNAPVYSTQYADTLKHLQSTAAWTHQLSNRLNLSNDGIERRQIRQALQGIHQLRRLCLTFQDLLCTRDAIAPRESFAPIPRRLQAKPSVYDQLHRNPSQGQDISQQNYYQILSCLDDTAQAPPPDNKKTRTMTQAPTTFHKNTLDDLIREFTEKDLPMENARPDGPEVGKSFRIRFSIRMGNFTETATIRDKLEAALSLLKANDPSLCILPYRKEDITKLPQLFNSSDIPADLSHLHKYFRFRMNPSVPSTTLVGQIHLTSALSAEMLLEKLCQLKGKFELAKLQCQLEETVMIGFLLRSSDLINRKDLTAGILQHPLWNPEAGFEFVISRQPLRAGADSTMCLAVEATATKAKEASEFFEKLYDGENKALPHGLELFYVPVFQGSLSDEDRAAFVQVQKAFTSSEKAITIAGFQDLEDVVQLADGATVVTIRHLLLSIPVASNGSTKFFQGIDRQPMAKTDFLIVRISGDLKEQEVSSTMEHLEHNIRRLVHPSNYSRVFKVPEEGLRYGGFFAQFGRRRRPTSVPSPERREHIQRIRAKMAPFINTSSAPPPAWVRPLVTSPPSRTPTSQPATRRMTPDC